MSKYTTQLRFIVEQTLADAKVDNDEINWSYVYKKLGLDDYPIYDEAHRKTLNNLIIRCYYFREIGFETVAQFRWYVRSTMFEIMPYYNKLYEAQLQMVKPFNDYEMHREESWNIDRKGNSDSNSVGEAKTSSDDNSIYSDTPMSMLSNGSGGSLIESGKYATNATFNKGETDSESKSGTHSENESNDNGWRAHDETGRRASQAHLMQEYRKAVYNLDMEVKDKLSDLFMGLW